MSIVNSQIYSNTADNVRASHACKLPIAPMGKCLVDMCISILILCCLELPVWSVCYLRLKLQKFPSPCWEFSLVLHLCRAAVCSSTVAR